MLGRLGLAGRLVLILMALLVTLGLAGIAIGLVVRSRDAGSTLRFPLPDQAAAIADLLDSEPASRRQIILRAANSDDLRVAISASKPPPPTYRRRFPVAEWLVDQYRGEFGSRHVDVMMMAPDDSSVFERLIEWSSPRSAVPLRLVLSLKTGDYLVLETRGAPTQRLFGVPTGFWVGFLGFMLAGLAIWAIIREAKPLGDLAHAVAGFSGDAAPVAVPVRGAPDVQKLIGAVNAMQLRIATLLKGRSVMLGAVSHDLKTYVTRLRLRVEDIASDVQRDKAVRDLDEMTALIDSAISVARSGAEPLSMSAVDLADLVQCEVAERADPRLRIGELGNAAVAGDALGLRRVLANVIDNALRYGDRCEVALTPIGEAFAIIIDDDGPGIAVADRATVFEPFVRLEPSRNRETGGSGLGLAIVKQIVDSHGGTIEIGDAPIGGARVTILLPRTRRPQASGSARVLFTA
jgi:signal transduction histidine kinase